MTHTTHIFVIIRQKSVRLPTNSEITESQASEMYSFRGQVVVGCLPEGH